MTTIIYAIGGALFACVWIIFTRWVESFAMKRAELIISLGTHEVNRQVNWRIMSL